MKEGSLGTHVLERVVSHPCLSRGCRDHSSACPAQSSRQKYGEGQLVVDAEAGCHSRPHAVTDKVGELAMAGLEKAGLKVVNEGSFKAVGLDKKRLIDQHHYAISLKDECAEARVFGDGFYCGLVMVVDKDPLYILNGDFMAMQEETYRDIDPPLRGGWELAARANNYRLASTTSLVEMSKDLQWRTSGSSSRPALPRGSQSFPRLACPRSSSRRMT